MMRICCVCDVLLLIFQPLKPPQTTWFKVRHVFGIMRLFTGLVCLAFAIFAHSQTPPGNASSGLDEIVKLSQAHMNDEVILNYFRTSGKVFNLSAQDILYLNSQGVSQTVISGLLHSASAKSPLTTSAIAAITNTTYDPELLNTSHSAVELRALWRAKYPELLNSGPYYFPDMSGFLTSFVTIDLEIQAGRPVGVLPGQIVKINKTIDDYVAGHPGSSLPPELSAVKSRINFEAYSSSALNSVVKRIEQLKTISTVNPVQDYNIDQLCLVLMQEPYFTKKDQLTKVKNDFHAWMEQNEEQSAATLTKLAALNKDLRLSLDGLNQDSFAERAPQVKAQIDGIRDFIAKNGIKNDSLKPASTLLSEFASLSASYLRSTYKYGRTTAQQQPSFVGQTNNSSDVPRSTSLAAAGGIVRAGQTSTHASKGDTSVVGIIIGSTALIMLLISIILHAKGKVVFFADYTDALLTFLGPIAIASFTGLCAIVCAITNTDNGA
jgi:hypothetical protein